MTPIDFTLGRWLNRPADVETSAAELRLRTDHATDFWRETHYGFVRDNGHHLGFDVADGFTAEVRVLGQWRHLYDQAGLMLRIDDRRWIKAGIEVSDGGARLGTVVTDGRSDWSLGDLLAAPGDVRLRLTAAAGAVRIQASMDGRLWPLMRLAPFPLAAGATVGPMACSPERQGLEVAFRDFTIGPPSARDLHDLA